MPVPTTTSTDELVVTTYATTATNPGPGGYAAVWTDGETQGHWSAHVEESTAVRLAMLAIIDALERIPLTGIVLIRTGMQHLAEAYTNGSVSDWRANGWRRTSARGGVVANADLWEVLDDLVRGCPATIKIVQGLPKGLELTRCRKLASSAREFAEAKRLHQPRNSANSSSRQGQYP